MNKTMSRILWKENAKEKLSRILKIVSPIISVLLFATIQAMLFTWLLVSESARSLPLFWEHRMGFLIEILCATVIYCFFLQFVCRMKQMVPLPFYAISIMDAVMCFPILYFATPDFSSTYPGADVLLARDLVVIGIELFLILCHVSIAFFYKKHLDEF
ncbi:MAG: hypothetical protein IJX62_00250 [Clostridia bacterium]|nr:hypothetical protein [Clostridia bacterium]